MGCLSLLYTHFMRHLVNMAPALPTHNVTPSVIYLEGDS